MKNRFAVGVKITLLLGALTAFSIPVFAAPLTGGFGTTASGVITYANVTNTTHFIDFCPPEPTSPATGGSCAVGGPLAGQGITSVQGGFGSFSGIVAPVPGTILDMVDQPGIPPFTYFPVGIPVAINNFLTVSTLPTYNFRAEQFVNQTCTPVPGVVACLGGFILTQVGQNVSVSFTVNGTVIAPGFDNTPFTDVITGQFNNTDIPTVAAAAQSTGGIFSNTWSGSVSMQNPIPEPATITMFGIAAAAIAISRLRSKGGSAPK